MSCFCPHSPHHHRRSLGTVLALLVALTAVACDNTTPTPTPSNGAASPPAASVEPNLEADAEGLPSSDSMADDSPDTEAAPSQAPTFPLEPFTIDELFAAGGGGCGMTVWHGGDSPWDEGALLFHGLDDEPALIQLNGTLRPLQRTGASGEAFYGQQTTQTFEDSSGLTVTVEVTLGEPGEIESVSLPTGTLRVDQGGESMEVAIAGDAGC